jgi:hypothetical protein
LLERGRTLVLMPLDHDEINRRLGIHLHIELLQRNLEQNERSWIASGLGMIHNTVVDGIRRDIAVWKALLSEGQS